MAKKSANSTLGQIDQQELQHLITVSTGFIDAYIIENGYGDNVEIEPSA